MWKHKLCTCVTLCTNDGRRAHTAAIVDIAIADCISNKNRLVASGLSDRRCAGECKAYTEFCNHSQYTLQSALIDQLGAMLKDFMTLTAVLATRAAELASAVYPDPAQFDLAPNLVCRASTRKLQPCPVLVGQRTIIVDGAV